MAVAALLCLLDQTLAGDAAGRAMLTVVISDVATAAQAAPSRLGVRLAECSRLRDAMKFRAEQTDNNGCDGPFDLGRVTGRGGEARIHTTAFTSCGLQLSEQASSLLLALAIIACAIAVGPSADTADRTCIASGAHPNALAEVDGPRPRLSVDRPRIVVARQIDLVALLSEGWPRARDHCSGHGQNQNQNPEFHRQAPFLSSGVKRPVAARPVPSIRT
jgi:hypothetical protein